MVSKRVLSVVVVFAVAQCVSAQTDPPASKPDEGGWVVTAFLGGARTASSDLTISQPVFGNNLSFERVRFKSRSFDPPLYYGFRGGYFFSRMPFVGVEAEFIHLKVFSDPQQQVRVSGTHRNLPINRELPLGEIVQQYSISHGVNLLLFNVLAWQAAAGAELKLWKRLYFLGEYKFTRTRQRGKVFSGTAESLLQTHHGVFGLSYHFE